MLVAGLAYFCIVAMLFAMIYDDAFKSHYSGAALWLIYCLSYPFVSAAAYIVLLILLPVVMQCCRHPQAFTQAALMEWWLGCLHPLLPAHTARAPSAGGQHCLWVLLFLCVYAARANK